MRFGNQFSGSDGHGVVICSLSVAGGPRTGMTARMTTRVGCGGGLPT